MIYSKIRVRKLPEFKELTMLNKPAWPIEPRGVGTEYLESFTSYWSRLADSQWMSTHNFYRYVILPKIPSRYTIPKHDSPRVMYACNGYGKIAERTSSGLTEASGLFHTNALTYLPWSEILDPKGHGLIRRHRFWCTSCWKHDEEMGRRPYVRLSWASQHVEVCTIHNRFLHSFCPHCGGPQDMLSWLPRIWICQHCGKDLHDQSSGKRLTQKGQKKRIWVTRAVEALIRRTCAQNRWIEKDSFISSVFALAETHFNGDYRKLAKELNLHPNSIKGWTGAVLPTLPVMLDFCYRIDVPPDQLLLDKEGTLTQPEMWRKHKSPHFVSMNKLSKDKKQEISHHVKKLIKEQLEPPPLIVDICRELGITHNVLRYHFPDEYALISRRAAEWRNHVRTLEGKKRIEAVTNGVISLIKQGLRPSHRKLMEYRFVRPSDLRRPEVVEHLRKLQEQYSGLPIELRARKTKSKKGVEIRVSKK